jgi:hypothetical protein
MPLLVFKSPWQSAQLSFFAATRFTRPRCSVWHVVQPGDFLCAAWCIGPWWQDRQASSLAFAENIPAVCTWHAAQSASSTACASLILPLEYTRESRANPCQPIQTSASADTPTLNQNFARFSAVGLLK